MRLVCKNVSHFANGIDFGKQALLSSMMHAQSLLL